MSWLPRACLHNADTICSENPHGAFRVHSLASKTPQEKIRKNPDTRGDKKNGHKGQGKLGMVAGRFLLGMTAAKNSRIVDEKKRGRCLFASSRSRRALILE